jgi:ribokinase
MTECTERSEGREGMPHTHSMTECIERTERSEGLEGMPQEVTA